jgi:hypothetical protein
MHAFNRFFGGRSMGLVGCFLAATLTACSGAGPLDESAGASTTAEREAPSAGAAVDENLVRMTGTIESAVFAPGTRLPAIVVGADVCLTVAGVATCAASDELGRYSFSVPKTDEPGTLTVTHGNFATTTTTVSLLTDVSHSLGVLPRAAMPATGSPIVLVRSFIYVEQYLMTVVGPGIAVRVSVGGKQTALVTDRNGFAMVEAEDAGAIIVTAAGNGIACDVWGGNVAGVEPAEANASPGAVTEVDVICRMGSVLG